MSATRQNSGPGPPVSAKFSSVTPRRRADGWPPPRSPCLSVAGSLRWPGRRSAGDGRQANLNGPFTQVQSCCKRAGEKTQVQTSSTNVQERMRIGKMFETLSW